MWQVHDRRSKTDWPRVQINLAKKIPLRYIALTLHIRYVGIRVALTTVKRVFKFSALLIVAGLTSAVAGTTFEVQPSPTPANENSHDIFSYETTYTFQSDFKESKLGDGDSLYNDFSYDHRFLITGKWYISRWGRI